MLKRKVTPKVAALVEEAAAAAAAASAGAAAATAGAAVAVAAPALATSATDGAVDPKRAVTTAGDALLTYLVCWVFKRRPISFHTVREP